jgi:hypothetical protein
MAQIANSYETMDDFQKLVSDIAKLKYIKINDSEYCITQLADDLEWLSKTVSFTKAFSDYLMYSNKPKTMFIETPIDISSQHNNDNLHILETTPFLKYKDVAKDKYRTLLYVLKQLYKNALTLPDAERVSMTIATDFNLETDLYLKTPEFIIDNFIYHIYSHNHISENCEKVLNIIKVFEYLYYKTINYINELEFDALYYNDMQKTLE